MQANTLLIVFGVFRAIKINIIRILFTTGLVLQTQAVLASDDKAGEQLYKAHCASCHGLSGGMDMSKRIAPPIAGVRRHYLDSYPDRDSFVMIIADWVENPDAGKSLMPGAIRRFNIMPRLTVDRQDVEKIAAYIHQGDIEKPAGFDEHEQMMHGRKHSKPGS